MSKTSNKRLTKEALMINKESPPFCYARPREDNILEWHYILRGPPDTPFAGGEYWGQLIFPSDYPFKPPGIKMSTPSGRFKPDTKICMSMSDFHPGTWNPAWSVATILTGMLSFMISESPDEAVTTGSISASAADRKVLAARSHAWNIGQKKFTSIFPEYTSAEQKDLPNMGEIRKSAEVEAAEKAAAEEDARKKAEQNQVRSNDAGAAMRDGTSTTDKAAPLRAGLTTAASAAALAARGAPTTGRAAGQQQAAAAPGPFGFSSKVALAAIVVGLFLARLFSGNS